MLVTQSRDTRHTDPGLSLRLATTAMGLVPDESTRANLTDALDSGYAGEIPAHKPISAARYRPDGRVVALADTGGTLTFWAGTMLAGTLNTGDLLLNDVAFSPDGKTLATIGKRLQIWYVHDLGAPRLLSSAPAEGGQGLPKDRNILSFWGRWRRQLRPGRWVFALGAVAVFVVIVLAEHRRAETKAAFEAVLRSRRGSVE